MSSNSGCISYFVHFLCRLLSGEEIPLTELLFVLGAWNCPSVLVFSIVTAIYWDRSVVYNHDASAGEWAVASAATLVTLCGWHLCAYMLLDVCSMGRVQVRVPVWSGRLYFVGHVVLGIYAVISIYRSDQLMKDFAIVCWAGYWLIFSVVAGAYQYVLVKYARHLWETKQSEEETTQESDGMEDLAVRGEIEEVPDEVHDTILPMPVRSLGDDSA